MKVSGKYSTVVSMFFTNENFLPQLKKQLRNIKDKYCYDLTLYTNEVIKILDKIDSKKCIMSKNIIMATEEQIKDLNLFKKLGPKKYKVIKDLKKSVSI